jgi:thiamine-monophosphate kinase
MTAPAPPPRTEISAIGEFGLIDRLRNLLDDVRFNNPGLLKQLVIGIDDDAAAFRPSPEKLQLLTTDALVEGVHFDLTFTSFRHLGWKAMAASLSDIAAMGGEPRFATVMLSLPGKISVEMVEELYQGMAASCREYSFLIAGGDTTASMANMTLSVTLTGEVGEQYLRRRNTATPGEYLCVTGHLGASIAGLKILQREKERFRVSGNSPEFQPNLAPYALAIERHLMPRPRFDISGLLAANTIRVGAMIDISDGLAAEVHHLCMLSNVGMAVYEHNLPVESITQHIADELKSPVSSFALYGGEEYELLFTLSEPEFERLGQFTSDITILGRVTEATKGIHLVKENGEQELLPAGGWDHFRS